MKELIQRHKNKLLIASPLFLLCLIILGAFYIMAVTGPNKVEDVRTAIKRNIAEEQFSNLDIKAKAFVIYDATSKRVVYSRNKVAQLPLASLTKIMSAIIALDIAKKDTIIDVQFNDMSNNPNDRTGLTPGRWRLDDLLKLTLVSSSNSGIITISDTLKEPNFIQLMNTKAKILGLKQTHYLNESGLDMNATLAGAYGSAVDMATLFDYAIKLNPEIFGATRFNSIVINSADGQSENAQNTNVNVGTIRNLVASKTGFTELAQGNLAIAFDADQKNRIIIVVLGSTQDGRFTDTETLTRATLSYYSLI